MSRRSDVDEIASYVTRRAGLSFAGSRGPWLRDAVARVAGGLGADLQHTTRLIDSDEDAFARLCDEVTVQESFFFRERNTLDLVRNRFLPGLGEAQPPVRVWSAGCAGGEEPYTLAVLLRDAGLAGRASVLGTDLSAGAIDRARQATYGRWAMRGLDDATIARCFTLGKGGWQVREAFRSLATFERHNLLDPPPSPPGGFDLVMCRNVLIYLTPKAATEAAGRLASALAPAGWLVTSASDPPLDSVPGLESVPTEHGIAYRRPVPDPAPQESVPGGRRFGDVPRERLARSRRTSQRPAGPSSRSESRRRGPDEECVAAERALELGNPREAERSARRALTGGPDVVAHRLLVRALGEQNRLSSAIDAAEKAIAAFPLDAELRHLHALLLLEARQPERAVTAARRAVYLDPRSAGCHLVLARCHEMLGDPDAARRGRRNAGLLMDTEATP